MCKYEKYSHIVSNNKLLIMKTITTLLLMLLCLENVKSQTQNPVWSLPPNLIVNNGVSPLPINSNPAQNDMQSPWDYYDGVASHGSSNAMADVNGNLYFSIQDGLIYDNTGKYIDFVCMNYNGATNGSYGTNTTPFSNNISMYQQSVWHGQETVIVPHPTHCNQYYIFGTLHQLNYLMKPSMNQGDSLILTVEQLKEITPTPPANPDPGTPEPDSTWIPFSSSFPYYCLYDAELKQVISRGPWFDNLTGTPGQTIQYYGSYFFLGATSTPIFTDISTSNPSTTNGDTQTTLTSWQQQTTLNGGSSLAATTKQADGSYYVLCHLHSKIVIIRIKPDGSLSYWKTLDNTLINGTPSEITVKQSEMEIVFDAADDVFRMATGIGTRGDYLYTCELTPDLLTIVNQNSHFLGVSAPTSYFYSNSSLHGLEFSPSTKTLYYTTGALYVPNSLAIDHLRYTDFNTSPPTYHNINNTSHLQNGFIELAQDNKMYIASYNGLYSISNPDNPASLGLSASVVIPMPIVANYCGGFLVQSPIQKNYTLPDQIDGMNYVSHFTDNLACCKMYTSYSADSYTFSSSGSYSNTTVNPITNNVASTLTIRDELRIAKGTVVTLKDLNIYFAPDAKLVIEEGDGTLQGGRLVLDNCHLTVDTRCSNDMLWTGIEVWGKQNENQGFLYGISQQGRLVMKNNSVIEHALRGVLLGAYTNQYNLSKSGGILLAENCTFRNNQRDIIAHDYIAPNAFNNQTRIVKCNFTVDSPLKSGVLPINHIQLRGVKGIAILGNTFNHSYAPLKQVGVGVFSVNSSFLANAFCSSQTAPCLSYLPNKFENLRYGIYVSNSNSLMTFSADRNTFVNNYYGIWANGTSLANITRNTFQVFESPSTFAQTTGIRMIGCTKYKIQENSLYSLNAVPGSKTYGIVIENSGPESNLVYRNDFRNLYIGGQSQRINSDIQNNNKTGLFWQCNNFKAPIQSNDLTVIQGSIAYHQGYTDFYNYVSAQQKAANNLFSSGGEGMVLEHDFALSNATPINYVYTSSNTVPDSYTASLMTTQQSFFSAPPLPFVIPVVYNPNIGCPTKIPTSKWGIQININQLNTVLIPKQQQLANGNSDELKATVLNASFGSKKNALLAASPYVSDEVLLLYLGTNPPAGHIMQVMMANSKLSSTVLNALANHPLPNGIRNMILMAQLAGFSPRENLENDVAYLSSELYENINDLIRMSVLDTSETADFTEVINILSSRPEKTYKEMLLNVRILQQNAQEATNLLDTVGVYGRTNELNQIQISTIGVNNVDSLLLSNTTSIATIHDIATDTTHCICASRANSMLCSLYGYPFTDDIFELSNLSARGINNSTTAGNTITPVYSMDSRNIEIYPNPTTGKLVVSNHNIEGQITVYSMQGKAITSFIASADKTTEINIDELAEGIYFIELKDNTGAVVLTERVLKK